MGQWKITLEETGEIRQVDLGEFFMWDNGDIDTWLSEYKSNGRYRILRRVNIEENIEPTNKIPNFDEWNW